jgi:NAD(P)-dependent dehydrogenase (short-subunit alcohol dehydrogenase family)
MKRLEGKTALITGGTTGIGLETARRFVAEGAKVAITGSNKDNLAAAAKDLGAGVLVIRSDAASSADRAALAAEIAAKFGKLDILFANAGVGTFGPLESFAETEFDRQIAINVKGPLFLVKELLPHFSAKASIVLNASIVAHVGLGGSAVYTATKGAVLSLARALAVELVGRGIRVNTISPGPIATPIYDKLGMPADQVAAMAEQIKGSVPMKRFGLPVEIAQGAVFLGSDESSYMTAGELVIDGGMIAA